MKLDFNLQVAQKQGITLTAQVQQAIQLLQMTNLEVAQYVETKFQDNPFLEDTSTSAETANESIDRDQQSLDKTLEATPYKSTEGETNLSKENQFETGDAYTPRSTVAKETTDFDAMALISDDQKSIYTHCADFLGSLNLPARENMIAVKLIEALEPTGWLSEDYKSIAAELSCPHDDVSAVLDKMQEIEPAGLFARNLRECLTLQAKDKDVYSGRMKSVLDNLHLMASGKFDLLKRKSSCNDMQLAQIFKLIKSFDPKPGLKFEQNVAPIRSPDLRVSETKGGWSVELNNSTLPNIKVDKISASTYRGAAKDPAAKEYIKEKFGEAKWLQKAIQKRNETMLKVGSEIVKRQTSFLEKGAQYIKPMVLKDIADAIGMHESTISRVTTGSLMQTPRGTLELKAFFSVGLATDDQEEATSSTSIKFKIKKLIAAEDPSAPLSDDHLVDVLKQEGFNVARRTIAKYRKLENIPSSFVRKRQNIISGMV